MNHVSNDEADCMIQTIEKFYEVMCEGEKIMDHSKSDFTQKYFKKLTLFMIPVLGALILQAAYGAVDLLVVGRFGTTAGLSAVSTGSQVLNLITLW